MTGKVSLRKYNLKLRYGITPDQYGQMLKDQNYKCLMCGQDADGETLAVDHNHLTNTIRGLLHSRCNRALGLFNEDPALLRKAVSYLETHAIK